MIIILPGIHETIDGERVYVDKVIISTGGEETPPYTFQEWLEMHYQSR